MNFFFIRLLNLFLIFWHLVDLSPLGLVDVSLSSSLVEIPSLKEDIYDKYLFGCTYTPSNKRNS